MQRSPVRAPLVLAAFADKRFRPPDRVVATAPTVDSVRRIEHQKEVSRDEGRQIIMRNLSCKSEYDGIDDGKNPRRSELRGLSRY